jgi:PAS domain S-box-containing protein
MESVDGIIRLIVDNIPDSICVIGHDGEILLVNRTWTEFAKNHGNASPAALGPGANYLTVCAEANGPYAEGAEETLAGLQGVLDGSQLCFTRTYACVTSTDERWFELHATPLTGSTPSRLLIIHRDITQTVNAERALRASESRYRQIMETSREGIWAMDESHRTTLINSRMAQMLGYEVDQVVGLPVETFMLPEDLPVHSNRMRERRAGSGGTYEHRFRRKDGSILITRVSATSLTDAHGAFAGSFAMFTDITDQKEAERSLVEIQEQLRTFFNNAALGMGILDAKGKPLSVNPLLAELAQLPLIAAMRPENGRSTLFTDPVLQERITTVASTRQPMTDLRITATGRTESEARHFDVSLFPIAPPASPTLNIGIITVETTTSVRASERIEQSLREKEILLKEVHHRVKNNMQVISSLLNMQGRSLQDPVASQAFDECRHRVRSMALVHERLYSAADLGRIDFGDYARFLVAQLGLSYKATNVRIATQCERMLFGITTAIPAGLILNELSSNAFKYAFPEERQGMLTVTVRPENGSCFLRIEDDGVGIPAGVSTDNPSSLGLQLVRALVLQLEGTIEFRGDHGTQITLLFPLELAG